VGAAVSIAAFVRSIIFLPVQYAVRPAAGGNSLYGLLFSRGLRAWLTAGGDPGTTSVSPRGSPDRAFYPPGLSERYASCGVFPIQSPIVAASSLTRFLLIGKKLKEIRM
jgi:hypothetical protein